MPADIQAGNLFGDKVNAEETIKKLVELERAKADKWENDKFLMELRKKAWEGLQKKLKEIDTSLKDLYNPINSPFRKMKTKSQDETILEAIADSKITPGDYNFKILRIATPDIFKSDILDRNTKLEEMKFEVLFDNKTYKGHFKGGSLDALVVFLNQNFGSVFQASIIKVDRDNVILHIEGKETGEDKQITFRGELEPLKRIGLIQDYTYSDMDLEITKPQGLGASKPLSQMIKEDALCLAPGDEIDKTLSKRPKGGSKIFLVFEMKIQKFKPDPTIYEKMQEVGIGVIDKIWVGDVDIEGEPLLTDPNFGADSKQENNDGQILTINYEKFSMVTEFPFNSEKEDWQTVRIELKEHLVTGFHLQNPFSGKEILFRNMKIVDENKKGFKPKNLLSQAGDAKIIYKGTEITRSSNKINDILPGLNLTLKKPSEKEITINVDWNYEGIEEKIFQFVILYNNAMDYIKNITKATPFKNQKEMNAWREEFKNLTKKEAEEKAQDGSLYTGVLNGDNTVSMIKTKLRSILMAPYETSAGSDLRFVSQLGIENTKYTAGSSTEEERENLSAGYMDFNKEKFRKVLKENYLALQEFFYSDKNKDIIYDDGLAIKMNEMLKMIASDSFRGETGAVYPGVIKARITMLENSIKARQNDIDKWAKHVEDYERQLKAKFAQMYKAFEKSKTEQRRFENFGKNNNN